MKNVIKLVMVIIVLCLTSILIVGIVSKTQKSKIAKDRIKTLPHFSYKTLSDSLFRSDEIKEGPVLVLFFNPECEHCKYQIKSLFKSETKAPGIHILLISNARKEEIRSFIKDNNLLEYPGLIVLVDDKYSFGDYFGTELVPSTFIYGKKLNLIRYFQGEVNPETIRKYLKQDD